VTPVLKALILNAVPILKGISKLTAVYDVSYSVLYNYAFELCPSSKLREKFTKIGHITCFPKNVLSIFQETMT